MSTHPDYRVPDTPHPKGDKNRMSLEPNVDMSAPELEVFLAEPRMAVLATILGDGMPSLNPVWFLYEEGRFLVSLARSSYYAKNLLRDPRASICVQEERSPVKGVVARGAVTVEADTEFGLMRDLAMRHQRPVEGAKYADATWRGYGSDLVVVAITPERLASWDYGKRG